MRSSTETAKTGSWKQVIRHFHSRGLFRPFPLFPIPCSARCFSAISTSASRKAATVPFLRENWLPARNPARTPRLEKLFLDGFRNSLWRLMGSWVDQAKTRNPQDHSELACRCHPRGLVRSPWLPKDGQGIQSKVLEEQHLCSRSLARPTCGLNYLWPKHDT